MERAGAKLLRVRDVDTGEIHFYGGAAIFTLTIISQARIKAHIAAEARDEGPGGSRSALARSRGSRRKARELPAPEAAETELRRPPPSRELTKPLRECRSLGEAFQTKEFMDRIAQAAPSQIKPGMILRSFVQATGRTPALLQVDLRQAIGGFMTLAELGLPLTPTLGMAHMIPFRGRKKVNDQWVDIMTLQIIIGYQGLLDLALRSGQVGGIHAEVVMPGDLFDYEFGTKQYLKHRPTGKAPAGAAPSHAWAIGHLRGDVEPPFEVMPYSKVLQIRDRSQAYIQALEAREKAIKEKWKNIPATYTEAPWIKHEQAMARKTVLRQLAKMLPKSVELQNAISIDEPDRGYVDFGPVIDLRPGEFEGGLPIEGDEQDPATAFGVREHIGEATTKAPDSGAAPTQAASTTSAGAAETSTAGIRPSRQARPWAPTEGQGARAAGRGRAAPEPRRLRTGRRVHRAATRTPRRPPSTSRPTSSTRPAR